MMKRPEPTNRELRAIRDARGHAAFHGGTLIESDAELDLLSAEPLVREEIELIAGEPVIYWQRS